MGCFRLVAVVYLRSSNDCCYRKQSWHQDFREGQLYTSKLPLESDDHQVTALACTDLVLSLRSRRPTEGGKRLAAAIEIWRPMTASVSTDQSLYPRMG